MNQPEFPLICYDQAGAKALDRVAYEQGFSSEMLMHRAGVAALEMLRANWPEAQVIKVICGVGNNGGDGCILARLAKEEGLLVSIYLVEGKDQLREDAKNALEQALDSGVPVSVLHKESVLHDADVIVDALLGIGLSKPVSGIYEQAIESMNQSQVPILSLDIPSGLCASTGSVLGIAVKASATITFISLKQGLLTNDGPEYTGMLYIDSLEIPPSVYQNVAGTVKRLTFADTQEITRPRHRNGHKGLYGHLVIMGGASGYTGSVLLAGKAALRAGAGLVSVAMSTHDAGMLAVSCPELMCHEIYDHEQLAALIAQATVIAIGPGLRQIDKQQWWDMAIASHKPLIVDADALHVLAQHPQKKDNWILTPHPGEAAKLLGCTTVEIQADRFAAVKKIQKKYGGVVILKGCGTLIASHEETLRICDAGNPGMSSPGMGDVLTGLLGGLLTQNPSSHNTVANAGVWIHALAADHAAELGERGMIASDVISYIREWVN